MVAARRGSVTDRRGFGRGWRRRERVSPPPGPSTLAPARLAPRAAEITVAFTLDNYRSREEAVFREAGEEVDAAVSRDANSAVPNRYVAASRSHPEKLGANWNRRQILTAVEPQGGALLTHGLTDSPYSMRALAVRLNPLGQAIPPSPSF